MKINQLSLIQVLAILNQHGMFYYTNEDNYVNANWVCIWCKHRIYIGLKYLDVPEQKRAYFLSPQNYEKYVTIVEGLAIG